MARASGAVSRRARALAVGGVVGPAAFVTAWSALGASRPGYSPAHDAISRLAAMDAETRAAMTAGFVAFGVGVPLHGLALRSALQGMAWVLAVATGVATLGVAAFPLGSPSSDAAHGVCAFAGYAALSAMPLVASRSMAGQGRLGWARLSTAAGVVSGASLLATTLGPFDGLFQRIGLTVTDAWIMATAVEVLRGRWPTARPVTGDEVARAP